MADAWAAGRAEDAGTEHALKRRGLIAGAAALVAGMAAKRAATPVAANDATWSVPYQGTATTGLGPSFDFGFTFIGQGSLNGVCGESDSGVGVTGLSNSNTAVVGISSTLGVWGQTNSNSASAIGVQGTTGTVGVGVQGGTKANPGITFNGSGVRGLSDNGYGVSGEAGAGRGVNASSDSGYGVYASAGGSYAAVYGANSSSGYGVYGTSGGGFGIHGNTNAATGGYAGVSGLGNGSGTYGVRGAGFGGGGTGVLGEFAQYGVVGTTAAAAFGYNPANSIAVFGSNTSTGTGGVGVQGTASGGTATTTGTVGVYGTNLNPASDAHGIVGLSAHGNGLVGTANATSPSLAAVVGNAPNGANAGNFFGNVNVTKALHVGGALTVVGAKSAAVAYPDGSHRLVYCVESPESWLEDFGTGTLTAGKTQIKIDPDFVAVADTANMHVFVTPYANTNGLHVTNRDAGGFAVQENNNGTANLTFSWRVVAKRKDVKAARLATFDLPALTPPQIAPPQIPDLPVAPAPKKP